MMKDTSSVVRPIKRRQLLQGFGASLALSAFGVAPPLRAATPPPRPGTRDTARKQAAWRRRGIIYNNDGYDVFNTQVPATKEGFLSVRMDHIADCGVGTVFYCTTISSVFTHNSKVLEVYGANGGPGASRSNRILPALQRLGTDPLRLVIERCREQKMEVFWTLRLNDIHDYSRTTSRARWKHERPELVMGTPEEAARFDQRDPRIVWTLADFERKEIRDLMVRAVAEVLENYDVDGIDLDFLRHACYFKETRLGEPVTPAHRQMLTDMVRQMRGLVLASSERRGKPILLSARVLETMSINRHHGFDLDQWLEGDLLDFVTLGGYTPYTSPARELVEWCHHRNVPVYACIVEESMRLAGWSGPPVPHAELTQHSLESWRGAAANTWALGVDGIMTFNLFADRSSREICRNVLREIGAPGNLVGKDKIFGLEHLQDDDYGFLFRTVSREGRLPVTIPKISTVRRVLPIADDIRAMAGRVRRMRLRLYLDHFRAPDKVDVRLNGVELKAAPEQPQWLAADVPPHLVQQGPNELAITFRIGESASWTLTLRAVELSVQYV
jgi:hypothetical protein